MIFISEEIMVKIYINYNIFFIQLNILGKKIFNDHYFYIFNFIDKYKYGYIIYKIYSYNKYILLVLNLAQLEERGIVNGK